MFRTALVSLDYSAAQGPLLDGLSDLRAMGVTRVILTHVVRTGYGQGGSYGNKEALEHWLRERAAPLHAAGLEVLPLRSRCEASALADPRSLGCR